MIKSCGMSLESVITTSSFTKNLCLKVLEYLRKNLQNCDRPLVLSCSNLFSEDDRSNKRIALNSLYYGFMKPDDSLYHSWRFKNSWTSEHRFVIYEKYRRHLRCIFCYVGTYADNPYFKIHSFNRHANLSLLFDISCSLSMTASRKVSKSTRKKNLYFTLIWRSLFLFLYIIFRGQFHEFWNELSKVKLKNEDRWV